MTNYYTDSAKESLWVLTHGSLGERAEHSLTCFAAEDTSGFHIGQRVHKPKLDNSNWQPLEGEIHLKELLEHV